MNHVYRAGAEVLRLSSPDRQVGAVPLASHLIAQGIPAAPPTRPAEVESGWLVTAWERIDASPSENPSHHDRMRAARLGEVIRAVHQLDIGKLPSAVPVPWCGDFPHLQLRDTLSSLSPQLPPRHHDRLMVEIQDLAEWRGTAGAAPTVLCHGDVHLNNTITGPNGLVLFDWDLLSRAPAQWDHAPLLANTTNWGQDPALYRAFAAGYGTDAADDPLALTLVRLRNLTATVMMGRRGLDDPEAHDEFERRMRYWHGDTDAPPFQAR